jgi:hypothetical protein
MQESDAKKSRGRSAILAAHGGVTSEDEARLDIVISDLYGVDNDEAAEIHLNYHADRLLAALARRCAERGLRRLSEAAAIDALFRSLLATENQGRDDRYISFYT